MHRRGLLWSSMLSVVFAAATLLLAKPQSARAEESGPCYTSGNRSCGCGVTNDCIVVGGQLYCRIQCLYWRLWLA